MLYETNGIHDYKLKGRSFWSIPVQANSTWSWRKLLQLRPVIHKYIWVKVGNGCETSAWYDLWCEGGPLSGLIQPREIKRAGFDLNSTVADLNSNGMWRWHEAWLDLFPVLINLPGSFLIPNRQDSLTWKIDDTCYPFSSRIVWHSIRSREPVVPWVNVVWFLHCIPRHAFILWLIMRRKLLTQDKILLWSPSRRKNMDVMCCSLCIADFDSHEHLFFQCDYSRKVWQSIRTRSLMLNVPPLWDAVIDWLMARAKSKSVSNVVCRLLVAATAYFIWQERNNRLFANHARPPDLLVETIVSVVRSRLILKYKKTSAVLDILEAWDIHGACLYDDG